MRAGQSAASERVMCGTVHYIAVQCITATLTASPFLQLNSQKTLHFEEETRIKNVFNVLNYTFVDKVFFLFQTARQHYFSVFEEFIENSSP